MKILHYTLGLPPYRSGGLTKYATDLFLAQQANGHRVSLLYPTVGFLSKKIKIKQCSKWKDIFIYKIRNAPIVPLLYGIKQPESFVEKSNLMDMLSLESFYVAEQPDIFHIHTLMGLTKEIISFFKQKGVKIIFTSHDYFGLCFKVNFINQKGEYCSNPNSQSCAICNFHSPTSNYLKIRNSQFLLYIKDKLPKSKIKKISQINTNIHSDDLSIPITQEKINNYDFLISYYKGFFSMMDLILFNSEVTKNVYCNIISVKNYQIIPIIHSNIHDKRIVKKIDNRKVSITFIGNYDVYKGLPILKEALKKLLNNKIDNWELNVWGGGIQESEIPNIRYRGKYSQNEIKDVLNYTNLLVVPSLCKETFSLVTLEALSFGVPVLVSSNVGAKNIVSEYDSDFVYENESQLYVKLKNIMQNPDLLNEFNKKIVKYPWVFSFQEHVKKLDVIYQKQLTINN